MKRPTLQQILLITDGCSNSGGDPCAAAALAAAQGVTVNVIGILEKNSRNEVALREIEQIACQGGGVSQIVFQEQLAQTVQMVTRKAMNETIQGVVQQQLQAILGSDTAISDLMPAKRTEVLAAVEEIGEVATLKLLALLDLSGSMQPKLDAVKEALFDLSLSMNARRGDNLFSLYGFPGKQQQAADCLLSWTPTFQHVSSLFPRLQCGGLTPTAPALRSVITQFSLDGYRDYAEVSD